VSRRAGFWFEAMRGRGDTDEVVMTQVMGGRRNIRRFPHADADGVGALYHYLAAQGLRGITVGGMGLSQGIPLLTRWRQAWSAFRKIGATSVTWPLRESALPEAYRFELYYSAEELLRLAEKCRRKNVNVRILLLSLFHRYFSSWLEPKPTSGSWLIPVTLRRKDQISVYGNLVSYFLLPIAIDADAARISADFSRELKAGAYWGTYWMLSVISIFGRRVVQWFSDRNARRGSFMGTFSDLGEWTFSHPEAELQEQMWATVPPASTQYPIGICKLIVNGKMSLGVRINPRIAAPDRERIAADLARIKAESLAD
jgi:hypothetical protein